MIDNDLLTNDLCTHGFHIIDDFLELHHYQSLRKIAKEMQQNGLFKSARIGPIVHAQHNNKIRTDEICWLDENSAEPAVQAYLKQALHIAHILNHSLFLGLIEFETHFAAYQPGSFYKKHSDQFATKKTRKISCVYYLNEDWQEEFGGELKLYNQEDQLIQNVSPQANRFICFNSELPHEVCLTHQPRYSIAGWMKTRSMSEAIL
ncbi:2OG-Fe(II) oxygenase [Legionella maioricensis]|uniref:2OG-Fe(II) oxygenase n=1 Tax=Legionella maioricensis TaxID=2896528 RepID=A0A9X2CYS2_9GAMM|nr:2OG-Fe(II) oxygenase [Legionella maioricensis]MCL9683261.1 2OG-Fe(II) oxygenase [Legionella maioricensis]MCL9686042.1 2OG-Fe(II) oxygenase [Legionella maioricensis]